MNLGTVLIYVGVSVASFVLGGCFGDLLFPDNDLAPIIVSIFTFVSIIFMKIIDKELKENN